MWLSVAVQPLRRKASTRKSECRRVDLGGRVLGLSCLFEPCNRQRPDEIWQSGPIRSGASRGPARVSACTSQPRLEALTWRLRSMNLNFFIRLGEEQPPGRRSSTLSDIAHSPITMQASSATFAAPPGQGHKFVLRSILAKATANKCAECSEDIRAHSRDGGHRVQSMDCSPHAMY